MKKYSSAAVWAVIIVVIVVASVLVWETGNKSQVVSYNSFQEQWVNNDIKSIYVHDDGMTISGLYKNDKKFVTHAPEKLLSNLITQDPENGVKINFEPPSNTGVWLALIPDIFTIILVLVVLFFITQQSQSGGSGRGTMNFGKNRARIATPETKTVTLKDVAGADEEKQELAEIVDFLKDGTRYVEMGARVPKGVLLVGPPGTGKTLLAKAVAGEAGVPFFSISGSDFVEMYVGVGASRVRDLFADAKKNAPCIIFIDEIDAVGRRRGAGVGGGHDEREQTLNQLLVEMDGFGINEGIIIIAATNRRDILDPALLRAGRFDRQVIVGAPDVKGREEILKIHTRKKPLAEDVSLETLAKRTPGFAGADLENLTNEAALLAVRAKNVKITMHDFEEAITKVIAGPEKRSKVISEKDRRLTAYHEAGHAVVMKCLEFSDPVHEISIIPRGMAGGYTMHLPDEDRSYTSKFRLKDDMVGLLGGRVSESLILGDISTGAKNDIDRVSAIARAMVMEYGMSEELGTISYGEDQNEVFLGRDFGKNRNFSEEVGAKIDKEVKQLVDEAYVRAETILKENINKLHAVAKVLLEKEKIEGEEFKRIFDEA